MTYLEQARNLIQRTLSLGWSPYRYVFVIPECLLPELNREVDEMLNRGFKERADFARQLGIDIQPIRLRPDERPASLYGIEIEWVADTVEEIPIWRGDSPDNSGSEWVFDTLTTKKRVIRSIELKRRDETLSR